MYCEVYNIYKSKMHENNSLKMGRREIEVYYCKVLRWYVKWYITWKEIVIS